MVWKFSEVYMTNMDGEDAFAVGPKTLLFC